MADFKYTLDLDPSVRTNHTLMLELIGHNKRVLECGCATGYMSRMLAERGCRVTGVEIAPAAAEQARAFCEQVIVGDLDQLDLAAAVASPGPDGPQRFDVVVFGDVLEHLKDPLRVLRASRPLLAPEGYVVASIPNVAHGDVRLSLLKGTFRYQPLGLLDDTHIRFFTWESIGELFDSAGFVISEVERLTVDLFGTELGVSAGEFSAEIIERIQADPESRTYQFVVRALVDNGRDVVRRLAAREEARELELLASQRELASYRKQNEALEQDRDRWLARAQAIQAEADRLTTLARSLEEDRDRLAVLDEQRRGEMELLRSRMAAMEEELRESESAVDRLRSERDGRRPADEPPDPYLAAATSPGVPRAGRTVWRRAPGAARRLARPALHRIRAALRPESERDGP